MRESWSEVTLGEVFRLRNARLGAHEEEPPVFSLSKHNGLVFAADYFDKRVASARLEDYKVVPPNDWAYSTIHIDEGSIARNNLGCSGVISPMYTTFTWASDQHDPEFFELLLRSPRMLSEYRDHAQGSINRRRSLSFNAFSSLTTRVPPLEEQRRIVDLVRSIDAVGRQASEVVAASKQLLQLMSESVFSAMAGHVKLSELLRRERRPLEVKATASYPQIGIRSHGRGIFHKEPVLGAELGNKKIFSIHPDDLIFNIVFAWEGAVAVAGESERNMCGSHRFPTYVSLVEGAGPYLRHFFRTRRGRESLQLASPGSAGRNRTLNQSMLMESVIPVDLQTGLKPPVVLLDCIEELVFAAEEYRQAVLGVRAALVEELLAGGRQIPESYDVLSESA